MTVSILIAGGLTIPQFKVLSGATDQDVYMATGKQERVVSASVVNTTGGAITTKLMWLKSGGSDVPYWTKSVAANSTEVVDFPIRLLEGDKIRANGNTGITITLAVLNDNGPLGGLFGG